MVCAGGRCCRRGATGLATAHARECGAGLGAFLFVHRAEVLLVRGDMGAFVPAPYVDSRGEHDVELRRGLPLHLDERQWAELGDLVLDGRVAAKVVAIRSAANQVVRLGWF